MIFFFNSAHAAGTSVVIVERIAVLCMYAAINMTLFCV